MKHNYFFRLLLAIVFCSLGLHGNAATPIYLSSTGSDSNDGLSVGTPKATLSAAMALVDVGGTIYVSGMIDCTASGSGFTAPTGLAIAKNVTIQGTSNSTDGFDGKNLTRFFSNSTYTLTLKNLKLKSGYSGNNNGGAIINTSTGTLDCENVIFDGNKTGMNTVFAGANKTGAAIQFDNATGSSFKNCIFSNNEASKTGAIYINGWVAASTIKFEGCAFVGNIAKESFGGSAIFIRSANDNYLSLINCTIAKNVVSTSSANGGAVYLYKGNAATEVKIINCTITENTTAGTASNGAGVYILNNGTTNYNGKLYIYNSIIEGNVASTTNSSDLCTNVSPTATTLQINNSLIGKQGTSSSVPAGSLGNTMTASTYNYLTATVTPSEYKAKFSTFNTTYNYYPLLSTSFALNYGLKSYLTSLTPAVTTDQLGTNRSGATTCDAGAIEMPKVSITSTSSATTSDNPIPVTITFSNAVTGFDATDITVSNGTKGTLSGSGTTYSINITPSAPGAVTLDIAANAAIDAVGNGNVAATQFSRTYALAGSPPTVTISSTTTSTTQTNPIPVTFTFSETVTGFDISDITVGNGTKSNFTGSGTTYTVDITPTVQGSLTVDVAANAAMNATSNGNTVATQLVRTYYKDIYLSSTGSDSNDGFTPGTAVLKFSTALGKAIAGEKIYVSGMVDFSTETQPTGVTLNKNITIQGTSNATDGFDGKNLTRFFSIGNNNITLKNLKLKDGYSGSNNGGAIIVNTSTGSLICENVIFDGNKTGMNAVTSNGNKTGGAIHISNVNEASFYNCVFSNNEASKTGAIYINNWSANKLIKFESCAFVGNIVKESFGGSAVFILTTNDNNSISFINCTFAKNEVRTTANGGTIYVYKGSANTVTNIINCTVSENTTAGTATSGAGVYFKNSTPDIYSGKLYIYNSIIEGNTAANNAYSDFCSSEAPTTTTLQINNSLIGKQGSSAVIPIGCFGATNQYNYLTSASTTNAYKGGLAPYNSTSNVYPLYAGSLAIDYGASSYLTSLSPTITTDQLGNVRTVAATNYAGAWESTPIATTTPSAPTSLVATAGDGQVSVAFTTAATGGSNVINYKYSTDGTNFVACSPIKTTSPIVITGLSNDNSYAIKLKAVNSNGDSSESLSSNSVTPHATANDIVVSSATNVSALTLTPVSDVVVSGDVLTINQATAINSLTVSPGAKVTVSGTNALTATNGITLQSNASGTATLIDNYTDPTITATVEQYLPQGRNWYVSIPTTSGNTAGIVGAGLASSVSYYNEVTGAWVNDYSGTMTAGVGYVAVSAAGSATNKASLSGTLISGNVPVTLTRTGTGGFAGYNLIANPYPSYVNPMAALNAMDVVKTIWYRTKGATYKFETVNTLSGVGTDAAGTGQVTGYIPPFQAFWVRTNSNGQVLTFTNSMRDHSNPVGVTTTALKARKQDLQSIARIKINGISGGDEAILYFNTNASNGFDDYDSPKMFESASAITPEIYTMAGNEKLVINGLNAIPYDVEIPLGFIAKQAGDYSISKSEMTNFETGTRIMLKDKLQPATETELTADMTYHFSSQATSGADRFSLIFRAPGVTTGLGNNTNTNMQVYVNAANQITIIAPEESVYRIHNAVGQLIENGTLNSGLQTLNCKLNTGIYVVKVNNQSTRVIIK